MRTAASRSAMLCAWEPVKCWSRLPNWSGSTIRRSTSRPVWVIARAPLFPEREIVSSEGILSSAPISAAGSSAVAMMSMSLTESVMRRAEPAISTLSEAGCARSASTIVSATVSAFESSVRTCVSGTSADASPARIASSTFAPKPLSSRICSFSAAARRASSESTPSSSKSRLAFFGPMPGSRVISTSPAGNFARSLTAAGMSPSVASAWIFSWRVLPIPGISVARPSRRQRRDRARRVAHDAGRVAVGHDAMDDRAVELVEVAELVERGGDLEVREARA